MRFTSSPTALHADTDHKSRETLADPEAAQQEAGPRSPTAALEEGDEDEEEEEAPGRQGRAEGSEGSPCADGLPGAAAEGEPAAGPGQSQPASGSCFPRKRMSSKSLRVGLIPAPKRVCLVQEPKGECPPAGDDRDPLTASLSLRSLPASLLTWDGTHRCLQGGRHSVRATGLGCPI